MARDAHRRLRRRRRLFRDLGLPHHGPSSPAPAEVVPRPPRVLGSPHPADPARRLLVLAVTAIASRILLPETRWPANASEIIASALYVENWALAASSVDYLASAAAPTTVQHYWSLSIEEQFYLVWPVFLAVVYWLVRRLRLAPRSVVRLAMLAVVSGSLYLSITATADDPAGAYFVTQTRVWELAMGGFIATLPPLTRWRPSSWVVDGLPWVGLAMILAAGMAFTDTTPFPGTAALLPVVGAAIVIVAAARGPRSPTRLLALRPIQHVGDTSYSIYLWHWPLIVLWPYAFGQVDAIPIAIASIGLAWASKALVEDTFRFAPSLQPLGPTFRFAAIGMIVVSLIGGGLRIEAQLRIDAAVASPAGLEELTGDRLVDDDWENWDDPVTVPSPAASEPGSPAGGGSTAQPGPSAKPAAASPSLDPAAAIRSCRGAAAIVRGFDVCPQDASARMIPDPVAAAGDMSDAYRDGCWIYTPFTAHTTCRYGDGEVKIAIVGNSHAGQWLPALQVLAKRHGWKITTFLASRCNATDATLELWGGTAGCLDYGRWVMEETRGDAFDLVITSQRQSVTTSGDDRRETRAAAEDGYRTYLQRWSRGGTNVLILRDTPFPGHTLDSVPDCLVAHRSNQAACAGTREEWRSTDPLYDVAVELGLPGVATIDTTPFLCTETTCPAVIGSVVVYFDASHMTATYSRTTARFIEADILAALSPASP